MVLISGTKLAEYMYDYGVGFAKNDVDLKRLDNDYFPDYTSD